MAAGAADIAVVNRTGGQAAAAATLAPCARVGEIDDVARADIVVNATSIGMGTSDVPFDPASCVRPRSSAISCTTRSRRRSCEPRRARDAGTVDGLGMLVHQAVLQQELWTGQRPDSTLLRAAALAELKRRDRR